MEASNSLNDFWERICAWIPRKVEAPASTMSRAYWIPDSSCVRCYECESSFTIFNRRHHCRICGKVFCGKCSLNSVPASLDGLEGGPSGEGERVRVCNFCYKRVQQRDQGSDLEELSPTLSPSSSGKSLASSALGGGAPVVPNVAAEGIVSSGSTRHLHSNAASPDQQYAMTNHQGGLRVHDFSRIEILGPYDTDGNRSDDETEIDEGLPLPSGTVEPKDDNEQQEQEHDSGLRSRSIERKSPSSIYSSQNSMGPSSAVSDDGCMDPRHDEEADTASVSRLLQPYNPYKDNLDFETNDDTWNPPDPAEDEERKLEESEQGFDEEDEDEGDWGPASPGSTSSVDLRKARAVTDEHIKASRAQVDGHFRALVAQLLLQEAIYIGEVGNPDSWLEVVSFLSWQAASYVKPVKGVSMDPGHYVKVKCIASGKPSDSVMVKGVVCRKNVAHRRMTSRLRSPKVLLLGGALEYQRVSNQLSSLETLLQQEKEHLSMTVSRIESYHPNVLLVEKTVSRYAQDSLLNKDITLVLNVKKLVLERIARCLGTQVVASPDLLPKVGQTGNCELFHVEKYYEEHGSAGQQGKQNTKFLMFFEGCPKPQGCTILLKGANGDELKKVKRVMNLTVFAAYHLDLETSFLADEGATFSEFSARSPVSSLRSMTGSPVPVSLVSAYSLATVRQVSSQQDRVGQEISLPVSPVPAKLNVYPGICVPGVLTNFYEPVPAAPIVFPPSASSSCVSSATNSPRASPAQTTFGCQPGMEKGDIQPLPTSTLVTYTVANGPYPGKTPILSTFALSESLKDEVLDFGVQQMATGIMKSFGGTIVSSAVIPPLSDSGVSEGAVGVSAEADGRFSDYGTAEVAKKQVLADVTDSWHSGPVLKSEVFPSDQGNRNREIVVQLSTRCLKKRNVCKAPHFLRIQFYGDNDKQLGDFLRDYLFDAREKCRECDESVSSHVYCFTHLSGSLTISVRKVANNKALSGEKEGKIWMWHRCLKCPLKAGVPPPTNRVVMSVAAWCLSFGKFLELSFSNHEAASRVASCGHSLHRHHLRFYGFGSMVACFRYAEIQLNSVYLPPLQMEFIGPQQDEWLRKESQEIRERVGKFFVEVMNRLTEAGVRAASSSTGTSVATQEARRNIKGLQELQQKEQAEFQDIVDRACPLVRSPSQPYADILLLNCLRRKLVDSASYWTSRLHLLDSCMPTKNPRVTGSIDEAGLSHIEAGRESPVSTSNSTGFSTGLEGPQSAVLIMESSKDEALVPAGNQGSDINAQKPNHLVDTNCMNSVSKDQTEVSAKDVKSQDASSPLETVIITDLTSSMSVPADGSSSSSDSSSNEGPEVLETGTSGSVEADLAARRALSEGSFPLLADLSDSFVAWSAEQCTAESAEQIHDKDGEGYLEHTHDDSGVGLTAQDERTTGSAEVTLVDSVQPSIPSPQKIKPELPVDETFQSMSVKTPFSRTSSTISSGFSRGTALGLAPLYVVQDGDPRFLPPGHDDVIVAVYDDEASSLIAYALASKEHYAHIMDIPWDKEKSSKEKDEKEGVERQNSEQIFHPLQTDTVGEHEPSMKTLASNVLEHAAARLEEIENPLTSVKGSQTVKKTIVFSDDSAQGKVKFSVICYFAKQFDALRKKCCDGNMDYIRSLSRCKKWGAQGGKSNVFFAKTSDDRFIVKQVTRTELNSFVEFAPHYFKYLFEALTAGNPTCLAKVLGVYEVKVMKNGKETKMDVIVMENLLFARKISRLYDLKGSKRSRYNTDTSGTNQVLLDSNLLEALPTSPIFVGKKSKKILERAVWNDTYFLSLVFVMDYSLLVGVDEERKELVVGIIDFMRQYTWDKHLENWVKASGILGGPKDATPTVISPKQYKKRFRKAMATYFLMVPDDWMYNQPGDVPPVNLNTKLASSREDDVGED